VLYFIHTDLISSLLNSRLAVAYTTLQAGLEVDSEKVETK